MNQSGRDCLFEVPETAFRDGPVVDWGSDELAPALAGTQDWHHIPVRPLFTHRSATHEPETACTPPVLAGVVIAVPAWGVPKCATNVPALDAWSGARNRFSANLSPHLLRSLHQARDVVQTVLLVATRLQVMPPEMWLAVLSMLVAEPASLFTSTVAGDGDRPAPLSVATPPPPPPPPPNKNRKSPALHHIPKRCLLTPAAPLRHTPMI